MYIHVDTGRRETDTMPGHAGSSWYFLRCVDPNNDQEFAGKESLEHWNQVDVCMGGTEHASLPAPCLQRACGVDTVPGGGTRSTCYVVFLPHPAQKIPTDEARRMPQCGQKAAVSALSRWPGTGLCCADPCGCSPPNPMTCPRQAEGGARMLTSSCCI